MSNLAQDVRFALRVFQRAPGFAAAAVLTLAVGIGANTSIFSVANALLLRPLPYREPGRLVLIDTRRKFDANLNQGPLSVPRFEQVAQRNRSFGVRAALGFWSLAISRQLRRMGGACFSLPGEHRSPIRAALGWTRRSLILPNPARPAGDTRGPGAPRRICVRGRGTRARRRPGRMHRNRATWCA